jgi:AcrR family transcriptional regulator
VSFRADFEHRAELLAAALDEFCERGYDAASLNRILTVSRVSKGQLYHHFASKEGLYLSLVEWMIDEKLAWIAARHIEPPGEHDFFAAVRTQIGASLAFAAARPDIDRLSRALLAERERPIFDAVTKRFGFTTDSPLAELVRAHHAAGAFQSNLTLDFVTRLVMLVVNHLPELLALSAPADLEEQIDELMDWLHRSLT